MRMGWCSHLLSPSLPQRFRRAEPHPTVPGAVTDELQGSNGGAGGRGWRQRCRRSVGSGRGIGAIFYPCTASSTLILKPAVVSGEPAFGCQWMNDEAVFIKTHAFARRGSTGHTWGTWLPPHFACLVSAVNGSAPAMHASTITLTCCSRTGSCCWRRCRSGWPGHWL